MGRQDSSKGMQAHKPPRKSQAPMDMYRKQLGKKEFTGKSKKDSQVSKNKADAKKSALGIKDVILILTCGVALLAIVYMLLYFSIQYSTDDN
ncbi:triple QxxK/R motif-containing protein-like [Bolinopsis microptera]|uniref:triple QxxK/R motif-containing protein-like n=1 Tax=Bolinopsis microptera TaxID=2820187 RepID=UPI0030798E80